MNAVKNIREKIAQHLRRRTRGQILLEVLISIGVIVVVAGTIATLVVSAQRAQENARRRDIATNVASEMFSAVFAMVNADSITATQGYNRIYCPPDETVPELCPDLGSDIGASSRKGSGNAYRPVLVGDSWLLAEGAGSADLAGITFAHALQVDNVCRNWVVGVGWGSITGTWTANPSECVANSYDDPSTQRVIATITAAQMSDLVITDYVTRSRGNAATQTDWSGAAVADSGSGASVVTFTVEWSDPDGAGERAMAHICKTDSIDESTQTCNGGSWADSASFTTNLTINLTYTPLPAESGEYNYYVYVCDDDNACNAAPAPTGTFTVN